MTQLIIYPAAALFSGREVFFNSRLVELLESKFNNRYRALMPQRDGFEFSKLHNFLSELLDSNLVGVAVQDIIYLADMGRFVASSDVIIANLDEPLDEGVVVEITYARMIGKKVVGFRTDVRSPYGSIADPLRGIHFFPAYQCDVYIPWSIPGANFTAGDESIFKLAQSIDRALADTIPGKHKLATPYSQAIQERADSLFDGIVTLNDDAGMRIIAKRYAAQQSYYSGLAPRINGN